MSSRKFFVGLMLLFAMTSGCGSLTKPEASPLTRQISDLNSSLDGRQMTLDQYEQAKHDVIYATRQAPATNAK